MSRLAEKFSKEYPLVLLNESEEVKNEVIENTKLDPNSIEAWYDEDKTGPDSDIVRVGNFTWHREKSNENVKDNRDGKGISFFFARYACLDENKKTVPQENGRNKVVGKINEDVYSVIDTQDDRDSGLTRIISAWKVDKFSKWARFYYQGGKRTAESIEKYGEPMYQGADDDLSEKYYQEAIRS